jgi:predicted esterase
MKFTSFNSSLCWLAGLLLAVSSFTALHAAQETELKDDAGKTIIRYVVESPDGIASAGTTDPAKQVGLFLCFPEHDRPTGDEILPVREALKRQGLRDNFVLLAGHPQAQKFGLADHEPIEKLIAWAKKTYPINPRRIYMYGKGEGGKISAEFAMSHPKLVTAAVTYSWGWWKMPSEPQEPIDALNSAPEIYMVLGLRDLSHHITTVRDAYERTKAKGYHVIYREFEDLGARTYHPPSNDDAIAWATRLRNKNIPPSPEELNLIQRSSRAAPGAERFYTALALVGGAPSGAAVRKLLDSKDAHVRAAAAATCSHAIFDEPTITALAGKLSDSSTPVRAATIHALAMNANWRSEAAQQALIELATKAVDPTDRISAVDALAYAVRYQVKGVRQDPRMFAALVKLLDDKNEELRVMASNILAPIRDSDFRGDLGRPERKTPTGGWEQWLDEIAAKDAGYLKDYEVCGWGKEHRADAYPGNRATQKPEDLYCMGGASLLGYNLGTGEPTQKEPALAFKYTLQAAEQGYVPAEAAVGMMYANGKGVEQNYAEAGRWWIAAAEGGHLLAAGNVSMLYRGGAGVRPDPAVANKWAKFVTDHSSTH